jgi:hypothetical protein
MWCNKAYTHKHFARHKCIGVEDREFCPSCQRIVALKTDFISLANRKDFCIRKENEMVNICESCEREGYSHECIKLHSAKCKSMGYQKCSKGCSRNLRKNAPHKCFHAYCHYCDEFYQPKGEDTYHKCYLAKARPKKTLSKLAVWDTETTFDVENQEGHRVNAVGLAYEKNQRGSFTEIYFYDKSMSHEVDEVECENAFSFPYLGREQEEHIDIPRPKVPHASKMKQMAKAKTVYNLQVEDQPGPLDQFLDYILTPEFDDYTFIAHYGQAFDLILLLNLLHKRKLKCKPIFEGNKVITLSLPEFNIRFIDSHRFIPLRLDFFPKRFPHLKGVVKKGFFPYKFNKPVNYNYEGPYPDEHEYFDEFTATEKVKAITKFLKEKKGEIFNFKKELHDYLQMDIRVLAMGCCSLIKEFLDFQNFLQKDKEVKSYFYPFNKPFITVPQFIHSIWRTHGLKHKLYLLNNQTLARKDSYGEMQWLAWVQENEVEKIRTARTSGGQKKINQYYIDGYCEKTKRAWEFLGCLMHCHWYENPNCPLTKGFTLSDNNPFSQSPESVFRRFQSKLALLKSRGISTEVMWECEWSKMIEQNEEIKSFLQNKVKIPPKRLAIRDALRGGRCETFRMKYEKKQGKKLLYIDKNSLYPYVALTYTFPTEEPEFYLGECVAENIAFRATDRQVLSRQTNALVKNPSVRCIDLATGKEVLGLVQATVLPPENLYLPVLPVMDNNKLIFGLCRTCISQRNEYLCRHRDDQRYLTDVWTCSEVAYAVEMGYTIVELHEAVIYKTHEKIFEEFYALLAKLKIQSEPLPEDYKDDPEEYARMLNDLMPWLNIAPQDFEENPSLRAFAKLLSNSALGKLSQYDVKKKSEYVETYKELKRMFNDPKIKVCAVNLIHQYLAEVVYEPKDFLVGLHRNTHVIVYSHVTAYARLDMMRDMQAFMEKGYALYYTDTDSIVMEIPEEEYSRFKAEHNINSPAYGLYKEETKGDILEFYSLGCKNYAIKTDKDENILKVRGFTLGSSSTDKSLNRSKLASLVNQRLCGIAHVESTSQWRMKIDKISGTVKNDIQEKKYSNMTFDKRFIFDRNLCTNDSGDSLPYGTKYV